MLKICPIDPHQKPVWVVDKSFSIGSAQGNNLVIEAASIQPQHARLLLINGVYVLHDLASQTGTSVNGHRISQKELKNGDELRLGDVVFKVLDPAVPGNQDHWTLIACSSWLTGQEFPVQARTENREVKIGRAAHCDLIFPGTHLSREHALLTLSDASVQVQDLGSANGTFINDTRITEGLLYSGDQIRLDVYSFRIYGPGHRPNKTQPRPDERETLLRPASDARPIANDTENTGRPKQWKTRPTSPGNRSDTSPGSSSYNRAIKALAILLGTALVALALYLLFG